MILKLFAIIVQINSVIAIDSKYRNKDRKDINGANMTRHETLTNDEPLLIERFAAIFSLQDLLEKHFETIKNTPNYDQTIKKMFKEHKGHYVKLEDCYKQINFESQKYIINRYSDEYGENFKHIDIATVQFEEKLWSFILKNADKWYEMTEHIVVNNNSRQISTYEGLIFVDSFVQKGVYDDWQLMLATQNGHAAFVDYNSKEENLYIENGYKLEYVDQDSMLLFLDHMENKNNKEFVSLAGLQSRYK